MGAELAARLIHSADERIPVDDLELGVEFLRHAARAIGSPDVLQVERPASQRPAPGSPGLLPTASLAEENRDACETRV